MAANRADIAVIGSGPGGTITAAILAERGRDVALLEEGGVFGQRQYVPFGAEEMQVAYRRSAMTTSFGRCPVSYAEARCLGGGAEINSGLYHRPPATMLRRWGEDEDALLAACADNEKQLPPTFCQVQPASALLAAGAAKLGWSCAQTPRLCKRESGYNIRNSMSESFLPQFAAAGGRTFVNSEARALRREKKRLAHSCAPPRKWRRNRFCFCRTRSCCCLRCNTHAVFDAPQRFSARRGR